MQNNKYQVVFFGTAEFAVPTLERLAHDERFDVTLVVTQPDRPAGRNQAYALSPVKLTAQRLGLSVVQYQKISSLATEFHVREILSSADVGVVAAFGKIIPKQILDLPARGFLNIHPSVLPKYRGPAPVQGAIARGDAETGVTVMQVDSEMDHGAILGQVTEKIRAIDTTPTLSERLARLGADLLVETIIPHLDGRVQPVEQDHARATYTKLLERDDGRVNAAISPAEIERRFRAYQPWPGIWTEYRDKQRDVRVKITGMDGARITRVQPEGKREMSYAEFLRGYPRGLEIQARADD